MGVQKKKLLHRIMALAIAVAVGLSVIVPGGTSAEAATIPADVTKPSANCVYSNEGQVCVGGFGCSEEDQSDPL